MKMTEEEKTRAKHSAQAAVAADLQNDCAARDRALGELWGIAGYWLSPRILTTAEYRGEYLPPKMIRMPVGRSVQWGTRKYQAMRAWATKDWGK
jgi:hypothetical protein